MMRILVSAFLIAFAATPLHAEDEYFKGKTITIVNSTGNGGSYFNVAQALSRYMPRYIPGHPSMVVKSMPGGGNVVATNFMYANAPRDGTFIATINNSIPLHQVLEGSGVRYDVSKFNWLGSTGTYNSVAYAWHSSGITNYQDLYTHEVILGGTGVGSSIVIYPAIANSLLGMKFKIVLGYNTTLDIDLAMERGEVQARTGSYTGLSSDHPDWLTEKKVNILFQIGSKPYKHLKSVPLLIDLAKTDEQRQILKLASSPIDVGRPYLAPPDVPEERLVVLRTAFEQSMRDRDFLAEMAALGHEIDVVSATELTRTILDTAHAAPTIIEKTRELIGSGDGAQ